MRALDIAVFMWMFNIGLIIATQASGGTITTNATQANILSFDTTDINIFDFNTLISLTKTLAAGVTVAAVFSALITFATGVSFGVALMGLLTFMGIILMLGILKDVISPWLFLGSNINTLVELTFNVSLPNLIVTAINALMMFITFVGITELIMGRRVRDYG